MFLIDASTFRRSELIIPQRESSRLDFMHDAFRMTYGGKLYLSPLTKLENALDIGTGTGIWAIDLGWSSPWTIISTRSAHLPKCTQPTKTQSAK